MKALLLWTTLPAMFLLVISVNGASFDCAKGSNYAERTICTDRILSELDDQLALAYKNALANAPEPASVRASQIDWLKLIRNRCQDIECLRGAYEARLAELDEADHSTQSSPRYQGRETRRGNGLSLSQILNGTYFYFDEDGKKSSEPVRLREGEWSDGAGSSFCWIYGENEMIKFGDLNGDGTDDAAVILAWSGGGSGQFASIAAILNVNGKAVHVASRELGDRVEIKRFTIKNGAIEIRLTNERFFPGKKATLTYKLIHNKLIGKETPFR
jgi:uncharacterized protein